MTTKHFNGELRDLCHGILCTAMEGGVGYWCKVESYDWRDVPNGSIQYRYESGSFERMSYRVSPLVGWEDDFESDGCPEGVTPFTVSAVDILRTLRKMATKQYPGLHSSWIKKAALALLLPEEADFDSEDADVVFQLSALGEIRYG
jgi:hypothetical protein